MRGGVEEAGDVLDLGITGEWLQILQMLSS